MVGLEGSQPTLTSNEWLKGKINGMYKDSLEFDSDKLDVLETDWLGLCRDR